MVENGGGEEGGGLPDERREGERGQGNVCGEGGGWLNCFFGAETPTKDLLWIWSPPRGSLETGMRARSARFWDDEVGPPLIKSGLKWSEVAEITKLGSTPTPWVADIQTVV